MERGLLLGSRMGWVGCPTVQDRELEKQPLVGKLERPHPPPKISDGLPNKTAWQPCSARGAWEAAAGAVEIYWKVCASKYLDLASQPTVHPEHSMQKQQKSSLGLMSFGGFRAAGTTDFRTHYYVWQLRKAGQSSPARSPEKFQLIQHLSAYSCGCPCESGVGEWPSPSISHSIYGPDSSDCR
eukprot:811690-Pelagomonas_calceolata.AAC.5